MPEVTQRKFYYAYPAIMGIISNSNRCHVIAAVCIAVFCGCASRDDMKFSRGNGDVETFILEKSSEFGGHPITPSTAPGAGVSWRYSEDNEGVVIRTDRENCASLEQFLRDALGPPFLGPTENPQNYRLTVYRLTPKGGAIQLACISNLTQVIILKPIVPHSSD